MLPEDMSTAQERVSVSLHCTQHASTYLWNACLCAWSCWPLWMAATGPWPRRICTSEWVASNGKSHQQFHGSHAEIIRREVTFPRKAGFSEETEPRGWISISMHRPNCRERSCFILKNWLTWLWGPVSLKSAGHASWLETQARVEAEVWSLKPGGRAGGKATNSGRVSMLPSSDGMPSSLGNLGFWFFVFPPQFVFVLMAFNWLDVAHPHYPGWSPLLKATQL